MQTYFLCGTFYLALLYVIHALLKIRYCFHSFHQLYKKISAEEDIRRPEVACSVERCCAALPPKDPGQRVGEHLMQAASASSPLHRPLSLAHLPLQPFKVRLHPLYERLQPGNLLEAGSQALILGHNGWEALLANKRMTNIKENNYFKAIIYIR
jgi:hypothetical protein